MAALTRLGIIAGGGDLPRKLADHARAAGRAVYILGISGFAEPAFISEFGGTEVSIGEVGKHIDLLKAAGCEDVVFAGIVKRPDFGHLKLDMKGAMLLPKVIAAAGRGDDALLRVILGAFEDAGFRVVGADDVLADLLAPAGPLGAHRPALEHWVDIRHAARVASAMGGLDIGQGAVSCAGLILAVEAQEGTDHMLERCASLPEAIRGTAAQRRGVLVKRPKPMQERRIDLPTVGVQTVRLAANAGLAGIAVEAGGALVINRAETTELADRLGLFIYAFSAGEAE
ncbi:MAG: UDP-2,3-diacylglucosamine diphosphatase LpxI [Alphaproteobacteria bacterium]